MDILIRTVLPHKMAVVLLESMLEQNHIMVYLIIVSGIDSHKESR
jgi:hypothetical protein